MCSKIKFKFNHFNYFFVPSGAVHQFLDLLDDALKCLHHSSIEFILYRDINVNYSTENNNKIKTDKIRNAYNLEQVADFPTRIFKDKVAQLDSIYMTIHWSCSFFFATWFVSHPITVL
jgi:hypothetical protein